MKHDRGMARGILIIGGNRGRFWEWSRSTMMKRIVMVAGEEFLIRKYEESDYGAVIDLWQQTGIPCKPGGRDKQETMARELADNPRTLLLVAENRGVLAATVLVTQDGRKGWINRLAVEPAFQRKGLAKILLAMAEEYLENLGLEITACLIEDDNGVSMDFFKARGYVEHRDIIYFSKRKHADV